ncbi:MAG: tetratricopeptide repeat protein [Betaproteobacteria bacterium]|nr:tetratricopeptide repeat protein [Betaproteobacteria bacterium]
MNGVHSCRDGPRRHAVVRFFGTGCAQKSRQWLSAALLGLACAAGAQPQDKPGALTPETRARAQWQAGYVLHLGGDYERAIELFRASIEAHPTAEAHTFLGWSLSHLGRIEEAIAQCRIAIELDPDFGNPYNDIGVYLIDLGRPEEAIPWLEKAIAAKRYCCYQFPHHNLGRVLLNQGRIEEAKRSFERALEHDPQYLPALLGLLYLKQLGLEGL